MYGLPNGLALTQIDARGELPKNDERSDVECVGAEYSDGLSSARACLHPEGRGGLAQFD